MALGSIATLAVLIAAVIEGPKLIRGGNSDAKVAEQSTPLAAPPDPLSSPAPALPEAAASPEPTPREPVSQPPLPQSSVSQNPVRPAAKPVPQNLTPTNIVAPALAPSIPVRPAQHAAAPVQSSPSPAQASPPQASPAQPLPAQAPPAQASQMQAPPVQNELKELRERLNSDIIRSNTVKEGLGSIESQMSRQGLGLRADIREARTRADYQLQEARSYMSAGDVESAKQSLRYAESAIQTVEKFLGR
jgi:hypothetical protein